VKVKSIQLKNILSFGEQSQTITFDDINTIVGPNNSGKTNIFRIFSLVGELLKNDRLNTHPYHHNGDLSTDFYIKIDVKLNLEEIRLLSEYLTCSTLIKQINPGNGENSNSIDELYKILINQNKGLFDDLFIKLSIIIIGRGLETDSNNITFCLGNEKNDVFVLRDNIITSIDNPDLGGGYITLGQYLWGALKKEKPDKIDAFITGKTEIVPDVHLSITSLSKVFSQEEFGKRGHNVLSIEQFGLDAVEYKIGKVPELLLLRKYLEKRRSLRKGLSLFSLIGIIFNDALIRISDIRNRPHAFLPLSSFELSGSEFSLMTGEDLPLILFKLKNSSDPFSRRQYQQITDNFTKIFGSTVDLQIKRRIIEKEVKNEPVFYSNDIAQKIFTSKNIEELEKDSIIDEVNILIIKKDLVLPLELVAAGITESLLLLVALIGSKNKVVLLDEPALNLHPTFQRKLHNIIKETSSPNGNQIILITHSPYLVESSRLQSTWKITKQDNVTEILNLGSLKNEINCTFDEKIALDLKNTDTRSLLFSQGVVLVEGMSDKIVIEKVNRFLSSNDEDADLEINEWIILDINGKNNLSKYFYLCKRLGVPFMAVVDYDALMARNVTINPSIGRINTSQVFNSLYLNNFLSPDTIQSLLSYNQSTEYIKDRKGIDQLWYTSECYSELFIIAKKYNVFVFGSDLEGILQTPHTKTRNKPLRNFDVIQKLVIQNKIPIDFISMNGFLKEHMKKI